MRIWTLAKKEIRVLLRDRMAAIVLLGLPIVFILVLGLLLGESFGQKSDERVRISVVDLDEGPCELSEKETKDLPQKKGLPHKTWSQVVIRDLAQTGGIKVEVIPSLQEAQDLIAFRKRAAVLVFHKDFSRRATECSFLADGINPFHRDGVYLDRVGVKLLSDNQQPAQAAVVEQVAQVSLLRVLLPWMIGRAFEKLSEDRFITTLTTKVRLPLPETIPLPERIPLPEKVPVASGLARTGLAFMKINVDDNGYARTRDLLTLTNFKIDVDENGRARTRDLLAAAKVNLELDERGRARTKDLLDLTGVKLELDSDNHAKLSYLIRVAGDNDVTKVQKYRAKIGEGVQAALSEQFKNYDLTGKTWASLTKSKDAAKQEGTGPTQYRSEDGSGFLKRGAQRYQTLVPSYTVMFAFFLVLNVGWVFVSERREGTLKRLRAAPLTRGEILLGKLVPYFLMSLGQGAFLLIAGRLLFGLRWGPEEWPLWEQIAYLAPVVFTTSMASMGLALLVAAVARTEIQVALYGAVPVLVLALIGGCVLPRELMPESAQQFALLTPQGWALDAYRELLGAEANTQPNLTIVFRACGVLAGFGTAFIGLAWGLLRLD
jgi:ABC-type Na+ efflux pump permease subunit